MVKVTVSREGANPFSVLSNKNGVRVFSRESDDILEDIKKDYVKDKNFKNLLPKVLPNQKIEKNTVSPEYNSFAKDGEKTVAFMSDKYTRNYSSDGTLKKVLDYAMTKIADELTYEGEIKEITDFLSTNGYVKSNRKIPKIGWFGVYENKEDSFPRYLTAHLILPYELNMDTFSKQTGINENWCKSQQEILKRMVAAYNEDDASKLKELANEYENQYNKVCGKFLEFYNTLVGKLYSSKGGGDFTCYGSYSEYFNNPKVLDFIKSVSKCYEPFVVAPWYFNISKYKNGQLFREVKFSLTYFNEDVEDANTGAIYYLDISKAYKCNKTGLFGTGITLERDGKTY